MTRSPQALRRIKETVGRLMPRQPMAGKKNLSVRDSDIFLTSYPRSGNTWLRFLVANLYWPDGSHSFQDVEVLVPDIYKNRDGDLLAMEPPRILKSHECFDPRYPRVVYIIRDVRSVIVSHYYYSLRSGTIDEAIEIGTFAENLLRGRVNAFGAWHDNVASWLRMRGNDVDRFYLAKYEDLVARPGTTLKGVADFLGLDRTSEEIEKAVDAAAFERMQKLERSAGKNWFENRAPRKDISFVRSGRTNEWETVLDEETLALIHRSCGGLLRELGYTSA